MVENKSSILAADIQYEDEYVQPLILAALRKRLPESTITTSDTALEDEQAIRTIQWRQYEKLDFEKALSNSKSFMINAYIIRKALIRKHYLSNTISTWLVKHPDSVLRRHFKPSYSFELDFAEFLDDALVDCFELKASLDQNATLQPSARQWWILKPGMSDRGQGIRLFSTLEELTVIFEEWDVEEEEEEEEEEQGDEETASHIGAGTMISQLRNFVAQPYIDKPLLFDPPFESAGRKFHIRTYVVAVGALRVYVYQQMLALFAEKEYFPPWDIGIDDLNADLTSQLTNTCLQSGERQSSVNVFSSLPDRTGSLNESWKTDVVDQICRSVGALFESAARGMSIHFQPLPNAFEIFGLDFLVDERGCAWLLEVNAFPDFKQTGEKLSGLIQGLFENVVDVAIKPFVAPDVALADFDSMIKVLDIDLGRR